MPVTEEQRAAVTTDIIHAYQAKFGDAWRQSLTKNLRPSPLKDIAERHGVSLHEVRRVKQILWMIGMLHNHLPVETAEPDS